MQYLHRNKIIVVLLFIQQTNLFSQGRQHNPNYDLQKIHFGFSIVPNHAKSKVVIAKDFYSRDSVRSITPVGFSGFGFGGIADFRIGKYFTVRWLPQIQFSQRNYKFVFSDREEVAKTETVSLDQNFLLKYHSSRHGNHRVYLVGGIKYTHDFSSNESTIRSPNRAMIPYKRETFFYEFGFGYDHFGTFALISTELKMSNSITNMLSKDPYIYTSSIDRIQARLFQISFHFQ